MFRIAIIIVAITISGCVVKKQYHDTYGFADDNKIIYEQTKLACTQLSYDKFPERYFYIPEPFNPSAYANAGGVGGAMLRGAAMAQAEQVRSEAIKLMKDYNKARKDAFNYCMKEYGWHEVEVEN